MTKYRLKDHELQEKLEAVDSEFGMHLTYACGVKYREAGETVYVPFCVSKDPSYAPSALRFSLSEIEEILEYDPKSWNDYPEVTPPEGVWMRVEDNTRGGYKAKFSGTTWYFGFESMDNIVRFRPWEDEE